MFVLMINTGGGGFAFQCTDEDGDGDETCASVSIGEAKRYRTKDEAIMVGNSLFGIMGFDNGAAMLHEVNIHDAFNMGLFDKREKMGNMANDMPEHLRQCYIDGYNELL